MIADSRHRSAHVSSAVREMLAAWVVVLLVLAVAVPLLMIHGGGTRPTLHRSAASPPAPVSETKQEAVTPSEVAQRLEARLR